MVSFPFRRQLVKIDFFWFSSWSSSPPMSFGFLMNCWSAGIITVEAKSGRVSRSRNCAISVAEPTSSAAFFCSAV